MFKNLYRRPYGRPVQDMRYNALRLIDFLTWHLLRWMPRPDGEEIVTRKVARNLRKVDRAIRRAEKRWPGCTAPRN